MVYFPLASVVVVVADPRTCTVTPASRSPVDEVTLPETCASCARAVPQSVAAHTRPMPNAAKARMMFYAMKTSDPVIPRVAAWPGNLRGQSHLDTSATPLCAPSALRP